MSGAVDIIYTIYTKHLGADQQHLSVDSSIKQQQQKYTFFSNIEPPHYTNGFLLSKAKALYCLWAWRTAQGSGLRVTGGSLVGLSDLYLHLAGATQPHGPIPESSGEVGAVIHSSHIWWGES